MTARNNTCSHPCSHVNKCATHGILPQRRSLGHTQPHFPVHTQAEHVLGHACPGICFGYLCCHRLPGVGGKLERAKFGMAKFGAVKIWHEFWYTMAKLGTKFPDCGIRTSVHRKCSKIKSSVFRVWIQGPCIILESNILEFQFPGGPQPAMPQMQVNTDAKRSISHPLLLAALPTRRCMQRVPCCRFLKSWSRLVHWKGPLGVTWGRNHKQRVGRVGGKILSTLRISLNTPPHQPQVFPRGTLGREDCAGSVHHGQQRVSLKQGCSRL